MLSALVPGAYYSCLGNTNNVPALLHINLDYQGQQNQW